YAQSTDGALSRDLDAWTGAFAGTSRVATVVHSLRTGLTNDSPSLYALLAELRRPRIAPSLDGDLQGELYGLDLRAQPWRIAGSVRIEHPLAPLRFGFLNGATLPGDGDEYSIHVQEPGFSQSFRAVWEVGDWDAGGIVIPSGESGEPGSGHYTDLTATWLSGRLVPLPFTPAAVAAATTATLVLEP
ncbi:MAG TPA: penicillin acylase family protein, partial [Verrucomicrobiae bacterium]|nr:penicillin acylase family protein [Verrucomicrobiae bacterium]